MTAISNSQGGRTGIALDVGTKRIGVATADLSVRFAGPLTTLDNPDAFLSEIVQICGNEQAGWLVIGLPRGLDGQDTAQTEMVREFGAQLENSLREAGLQIPVYWIDEALTSEKAEAELRSRPANRRNGYVKGDVDALAATYILEDFLTEQSGHNKE
jgi:putative Holliday junction resolvase